MLRQSKATRNAGRRSWALAKEKFRFGIKGAKAKQVFLLSTNKHTAPALHQSTGRLRFQVGRMPSTPCARLKQDHRAAHSQIIRAIPNPVGLAS